MKCVKIAEMQQIPYVDCGEPLALFAHVWVRKTVAEKLGRIAGLIVAEGYRHPEEQERLFLQELLVHQNIEKAHQFIALPSVAGHPTGGAVDVTLPLDMGGSIKDFSQPEKLPTFSACITPCQAKNRKLLHDLMIGEGFAPFYGEWWHFSYGDREWAAFYGYPKTLYGPVFTFLKNNK